MAQKFFGTIFGRRRKITPGRNSFVGEFKVIKPAKDIADFQYPPESSFYQEQKDDVKISKD